MLKIENQFIKLIKSKSNKNLSFIDEVASVLNTNYDAAYRRVNGKTSLSLNETVKLAKHFKVSLDKLFTVGDSSKIMVNKTQDITDLQTLESYFESVHKRLKPVEYNDKAMMYYSAKELPVFHILSNNSLFRFKIFVWLQILGFKNDINRVSFEDFKISESLINTVITVGEQYRNIKITEIWSNNILSTTLHQIQYFYESNLLSYKNAIIICEELTSTIKNIENDCYKGKRNNPNGTRFNLFYNPLMNSNNNVLIKTPHYKVTFVSYSILRYYEIENTQVCKTMERFLKNQISLSKQITNAGVKDIILFFKPLYRQIDSLIKQINLLKQFPIQKF